MASEKNKIKALQEFSKAIQSGEGPSAAIGKLLVYSIAPSFNTDSQGRLVSNLTGKPPTTTDIKTTSQKKETSNEKSIAKAKRTGRKYTILTSPAGLTSNFKTTKKTLLGG